MRAILLIILLSWTQSVLPCSERIGGDGNQRDDDVADRAEQRSLVAELAIQADTIAVVRVEHVTRSSDGRSAQFRVRNALKGTAEEGDLLTYEISGLQMIGCTVASAFKNTWALEGADMILYAQGGQLLRTGDLEREWPEISAREEIRRVQKALKKLDV